MSWLSNVRQYARSLGGPQRANTPAPRPRAEARVEPSRAGRDEPRLSLDARRADHALPALACRSFEGHRNRKLMELANERATLDNQWHAGRPLSEARNAHSTNTKEQLEAALKHDYNWLEGDIRSEIHSDRLEMRHDDGHESGDNLTLDEWLEVGKESGRGLKLDIKEGDRTSDILNALEASGVPDERLMLNLGDGPMARYGAEIRARFPEALLAVNPADKLDGRENTGPLEAWQVDRMIAHAAASGEPVTFVVRYDRLTEAAIEKLLSHGTVSVWNSPSRGGVDDVEALSAELRARGVNGVIDLRQSMGNSDKAGAVLDKAKNVLRDGWEKVF